MKILKAPHIFDDNGYQLASDVDYRLQWHLTQYSEESFIKVEGNIYGYILGDSHSGESVEEDEIASCANFELGVIDGGTIKIINNKIVRKNIVEYTPDWPSFVKRKKLVSISTTDLTEMTADQRKSQLAAEFVNTIKSFDIALNAGSSLIYPDTTAITDVFLKNINNIGITLEERAFYSDLDAASDPDADPDYYEYTLKSISIPAAVKQEICKFVYKAQETSGVSSFYPYYTLRASYTQEKVSVGLIQTNTFFILDYEDNFIFNEESAYVDPDEYFNFDLFVSGDSELRIISNEGFKDDNLLEYTNEQILDIEISNLVDNIKKPLYFSVLFAANDEGCYTNDVDLYILRKNDEDLTDTKYFFGTINIKSTAVGEDERYRALFANFGIPDPINYSNIFKISEVDEVNPDFDLVNAKSKELFLTYDKIFPYVGTYKALINAVKFLGYDDIYFKEWYKVIDNDKTDKKLAFQSIDIANGETLQSKLKRANITYEDFLNYKKLNKLSLIYKINEVDESVLYDEVEYKKDGKSLTKAINIPTTVNVYDYIGDALLAKLYALRQWLQKYIIGINCQIVDVTGEGVYFYRFKNQSYFTESQTVDYLKETTITPSFIKDVSNKMVNSSAYLKCTLTEFDNMTFGTYEKTPIKSFVKSIANVINGSINSSEGAINSYEPKYTIVETEIPVSAPLRSLVPIDEITYEVQVTPESTTLYEQTKKSKTGSILIRGNEIYNTENVQETLIDSSCLPNIKVAIGNIRKNSGEWDANIAFTIKLITDAASSNSYYEIFNVDSSVAKLSKVPFLFTPSDGAVLKYSENNIYGAPMLMFKNYKIENISSENVFNTANANNYILEIVDGDILFDNELVAGSNGQNYVGTTISFDGAAQYSYEANVDTGDYELTNLGEQKITVTHTYDSPRTQLFTFDASGLYDNVLKDMLAEKANLLNELNDASLIRDAKKERYVNILNGLGSLKYYIAHTQRYLKTDASVFVHTFMVNESKKRLQKKQTTMPSLYMTEEELSLIKYSPYADDLAFKLSDEVFQEEYKIYCDNKLTALDASIYETFSEALKSSDYYASNTSAYIKVNRLGNYSILAKAFDGYNNTYVNDSPQTCEVFGTPARINLYTNSENSSNNEDFYTFNKNGEDVSDFKLNDIKVSPQFPKTYRIQNVDVTSDEEFDTINYKNVCYSVDTVKAKDKIMFNNLTERIYDVSDNKLYILPGWNTKQNIYIKNSSVSMIIYNKKTLDVWKEYGPYNVSTFYNGEDTKYVIIDNLNPEIIMKDSSVYSYYLIQTSKLPISENNIVNNYDDKTSMVSFEFGGAEEILSTSDYEEYEYGKINNQFFETGDVVKLSFKSQENYIAETAYRVLDSSINGNVQTYELNGLVNTLFFDYNDNIKLTLSRGNQSFVNYVATATSDTNETYYYTNNSAVVNFDASVNYSAKWFPSSYLDNTYSIYTVDYNPKNLVKYWYDGKLNASVYKYTDYPITLGLNRILFADSTDYEHTFESYKSEWQWNVNSIENESEVYFRSTNDILKLLTSMKGTNDIRLYTTDKFGNRLVTDAYSRLCVTD